MNARRRARAPQASPHVEQPLRCLAPELGVRQKRLDLGGHGLGRRGALHELGDDPLSRDDVHEADVRDSHENPANEIRQPREPVDDHHGRSHRGGLQCRRSGGHEQGRRGAHDFTGRSRSEHLDTGADGVPARRQQVFGHALGARQPDSESGHVPPQDRRRAHHRRQVPPDLVRAAAGQKSQDRRRLRPPRGGFRPHRKLRFVEQRVPHELDTHTAVAVELLLERKHDRHPVHASGDLPHARLPPRPDLRAYVVEHADSHSLEPAREHQVESGVVNEHCDPRPAGAGAPDQTVHRAAERGYVPDHFHEPDDVETGIVHEQLSAGAPHSVTAHSVDRDPGRKLEQLRDDLRRVKVARGLTGDDEHCVASLCHRSLDGPGPGPGSESALRRGRAARRPLHGHRSSTGG